MTFPTGFEIVELPPTWEASCAVDGVVVTCTLNNLNPSSSRTIEFDARPTVANADAHLLASVTSALPDPGPTPNEADHPFVVLAREGDLTLRTEEGPEAPAGVEDEFTLLVSNPGPAWIQDAVLTATFPDTVQIGQITQNATGMPCVVDGQTVTCTGNVFRTDRVMNFRLTHLEIGTPVTYEFSITSPTVPEIPGEVGANTLSFTRTPVPAPSTLKVWVTDTLGNQMTNATVRVYRPTDAFTPSYFGTQWYSTNRYDVEGLPAGEYRVSVSAPGKVTEWYDGAPSRTTATPFVATGMGEAWEVTVVLENAV